MDNMGEGARRQKQFCDLIIIQALLGAWPCEVPSF